MQIFYFQKAWKNIEKNNLKNNFELNEDEQSEIEKNVYLKINKLELQLYPHTATIIAFVEEDDYH